MSTNDAPTDWGKVTPEEWKLGFAEVARRYGVSRSAAHGAYRRIQAGNGTPGKHGRTKKPIPDEFTRDMPTTQAMELFGVSRPTVGQWRKQLAQLSNLTK